MITIAKAYNNFIDLFKAMQSVTEKALDETADYIHNLIQDFVNQWYADYDPTQYQRTFQLLNCVTRTHIRKIGDKRKVYIYLDTAQLNYNTDTQGVLEAANNGLHGSIYNHFEDGNTHYRLWSDGVQEIENNELLFKAFEDFMKQHGINIKRI